MRRKWTHLVAALGLAGGLMASGCATQGQSGALIGSLIGAGLGQAIGSDTEATLIGAALGGGAGYILGNEQDKLVAQGLSPVTVVEPVRVTETVYVAEPVYWAEPVYVVEPVPSRFVVIHHSHGRRHPARRRHHRHR